MLKNTDIIKNTTCFNEHKKAGVQCERTSCKFWIEHSKSQNCTIIAAQSGPKTLQQIGDIFGISRMRICQIEKKIMTKIKNFNS